MRTTTPAAVSHLPPTFSEAVWQLSRVHRCAIGCICRPIHWNVDCCFTNMRILFVLIVVLLVQVAPTDATSSDRFSFFQPSVTFDRDSVLRLDRGEPVARVLPGKNQEVAIVAAVPTEARGDRLVAWMRNIALLKQSSYVLAIGRFSSPPRLADVNDLVLDDTDLQAIRQCRPGSCGLKLSAAEIEQLQHAANAAGADWQNAIQTSFRALVIQRVTAYLAGGLTALGNYDDGRRPVSLAAESSQLLRHSPFLELHASQLVDYLGGYPNATLPGVESFVYWSKEHLAGKAIISATHVNILRGQGSGEPDTLVAAREIFATHYLNGSLAITALVNDAPNGPSYLVYVNRSDLDMLGGMFGGMVRFVVDRRLKAEAATVLDSLRRRLERGEPPALKGSLGS